MEFDWVAKNYRDIVNTCLGYRSQRRPRGAIKHLSERLRCHSTFISQVLKGNAEFSAEQGLEICEHFQFSRLQQDFFLHLLARDRAGTLSLKKYYQNKLDLLIEESRDLKPKASQENYTLGSFESEYFGNWVYQAVHACTQIEKLQTANAISNELSLAVSETSAVMNRLEVMGLIKADRGQWHSTQHSLHLSKDSPYIRYMRMTWKAKQLSDLQNSSHVEGTRYNGVITVAEEDYQAVRAVLVKALSEIRIIVMASKPENVYLLSMDCYKI